MLIGRKKGDKKHAYQEKKLRDWYMFCGRCWNLMTSFKSADQPKKIS